MKTQRKFRLLTIGCILLLASGCSKSSKTENTNPGSATTDPVNSSIESQTPQSTDAAKDTQKEPVQMGRYVETNITLPEIKPTERGVSLALGSDDLPILYAFEGKDVTVTKYMLQPDGTWEKAALDWTSSIKTDKIYISKVFRDSKGTEYLYYSEYKKDIYHAHLYKEDQGKAYEISMEGWKEFNMGSIPENVEMMDNGTLCAIVDGDLCSYDTATGKLLADIDTKNNYVYAACENSIIRSINKKDSDTTELDCYADCTCSGDPEVYQYPVKDSYISNICKNSKGNYIVIDGDGILESNPDTHTFDTVLPGEKTTLYMPSLYVTDVISAPNDCFYVICIGDGYVLLKYNYDESIPTEAQYHLNIYSLYENQIMKTAIVKFQQKHPEYEFSYDYPMAFYDRYNEDLKIEDYIRTFNTQFLAGDGPDLIDLSDLTVQDYIDNGALLETTDIIQGYLDEGKLFKNIVEQFQTNGKYYAIPLQFSPICIFGPQDVISCNSLSDVVAFAQSHPNLERDILGSVNLRCLIETFTAEEYPSFVDNKNLSEDKLKEFIENIKLLYDLSDGKEREDDPFPNITYGNSSSGLSYREYCYINAIQSFDDLSMPLSGNAITNGEFDSFHHAFYPENQFGISAVSKNAEAAKEFYRFLYSDEFMCEINKSGFPINKAAFEDVKNFNREYNEDSGFNVRISEEEHKFIHLIPTTQEQKDKMESICMNLNQICSVDDNITNILYNGLLGYVTGTDDLDTAMNDVVSKIKLYVAE